MVRRSFGFIERAGLAKHMGKAYRDLSSGMQQRVKLALALAAHNELIVLDEPVPTWMQTA